MPAALLSDRGVIAVCGEDAASWLHTILTCDVAGLPNAGARLGALLSPQGKILFDFLIYRDDLPNAARFWLDTARERIPDLAKRLAFYRLRAKVTITPFAGPAAPADYCIAAEWGEEPEEGGSYKDPRHPMLGRRSIRPAGEAFDIDSQPDAYHAHRIALGVPEGGRDFAFGETFPHEALMDRLGGIDFTKGCYIGQEVVSRMQHRGAARTRIVRIAFDGPAPRAGDPIRAGDKIIGTVGGVAPARGLAMVRLDRAEEAALASLPLMAGGAKIRILNGD